MGCVSTSSHADFAQENVEISAGSSAQPLNHGIRHDIPDGRRAGVRAPHAAHTQLLAAPHIVDRPIAHHDRSFRRHSEAIEHVQERLSVRLAVAHVRRVGAHVEQLEQPSRCKKCSWYASGQCVFESSPSLRPAARQRAQGIRGVCVMSNVRGPGVEVSLRGFRDHGLS